MPLSFMNRLNQTESAVNFGCCISKGSPFRLLCNLDVYEGHLINSETLIIISVFIKFAYRKYNLSMAYLLAHTTKYPKHLSDRCLLVA